MIRLGVRLALRGGREAVIRLVITAAAVTLGACMLLVTVAGVNGINTQNARYAWINTGAGSSAPARSGTAGSSTAGSSTAAAGTAGSSTAQQDGVWWLHGNYKFGSKDIIGVYVAGTGPHPPVPPGIPRLPGPGQFYASPALAKLLRSTPRDQLADAFGGHQIGIIGRAALPAPNSLILVEGHTVRQLSTVPFAAQATHIQTAVPSSCDDCESGINADGIDLILGVVALALLFPVLTFIGTSTRLSAARREQRFAAMRLVGATPRQISVISAVESAIAAAAGTAAGFGLFFVLRAPIASIPFTGAAFFPTDLSLSVPDILAVAIGIPVAALVTARLTLRRVNMSPLGVSRRVTPRPPRAYRIIPLLAGLADLGYYAVAGRPASTDGQVAAFFPGFLLIMLGLVIAGPWLTMTAARMMARRTRKPATLIAVRRLADSPRSGFRAISGLILALFVASVAVGTITAITSRTAPRQDNGDARNTVVDQFDYTSPTSGTPVPAALLTTLNAIRGVRGIALVHSNPLGVSVSVGQFRVTAGLISCTQLARIPALGQCAAGAVAAAIVPGGFGQHGQLADRVWPAANISAQRLQRLSVQTIFVSTSGSAAAIEHTQAVLEDAYPYRNPPETVGERESSPLISEWQQLADAMILISLPIAGCTLAVSVTAGLSDRKRPFSLLRLTGAPLSMLRRVVTLESAVPLLIVAAVSIGTGLLATQLFISTQMKISLQPPGLEYYIIVAAGLAVSLAIIVSTFPLLTRITGPETARNE